jgi:hypothetical protein
MDKKEILDLICLSTMLPDPVKAENQTTHKFSQVGVDVDLLLLIGIEYSIFLSFLLIVCLSFIAYPILIVGTLLKRQKS